MLLYQNYYNRLIFFARSYSKNKKEYFLRLTVDRATGLRQRKLLPTAGCSRDGFKHLFLLSHVSEKLATFIFSIISPKVDKFPYFSLLSSEMICGGSLN